MTTTTQTRLHKADLTYSHTLKSLKNRFRSKKFTSPARLVSKKITSLTKILLASRARRLVLNDSLVIRLLVVWSGQKLQQIWKNIPAGLKFTNLVSCRVSSLANRSRGIEKTPSCPKSSPFYQTWSIQLHSKSGFHTTPMHFSACLFVFLLVWKCPKLVSHGCEFSFRLHRRVRSHWWPQIRQDCGEPHWPPEQGKNYVLMASPSLFATPSQVVSRLTNVPCPRFPWSHLETTRNNAAPFRCRSRSLHFCCAPFPLEIPRFCFLCCDTSIPPDSEEISRPRQREKSVHPASPRSAYFPFDFSFCVVLPNCNCVSATQRLWEGQSTFVCNFGREV